MTVVRKLAILPIQLYQRLLAMDHADARAVVDQFLKDRPLLDLYEQIMIPTLILAEQERHRGTLEPSREEFIFLCLNEIISELADHSEDAPKTGHSGRFFLIPAKDAADEVSGALFAQLLEHAGLAVISFPAGSSDELAILEPAAEDVICVSALPPFAFSAAAKLSAKLRGQFPHTRIMVGIWGFPEGREQLLSKLEKSSSLTVATTLSQALEQALQGGRVEETV